MKTFQEFSRIKIFDGAELHEAPVVGSSGDFNRFWLEETLTLIKMHTMEIRHYEPSSELRVIWCVGASDQTGEPLFEYDIVQYQHHSTSWVTTKRNWAFAWVRIRSQVSWRQ